jgi:hypothetical protein
VDYHFQEISKELLGYSVDTVKMWTVESWEARDGTWMLTCQGLLVSLLSQMIPVQIPAILPSLTLRPHPITGPEGKKDRRRKVGRCSGHGVAAGTAEE